jgi:hypothetical protein
MLLLGIFKSIWYQQVQEFVKVKGGGGWNKQELQHYIHLFNKFGKKMIFPEHQTH